MLYTAKELLPLVKIHGRTVYEEDRDAIFFDWTCAGFTVRFSGSTLRARVLAYGDRLRFPPNAPADYPCLGLVDEDGETLRTRLKCAEGEEWDDCYTGEAGDHTVRLVKLSENMRGKTALLALETDGELLPVAAPEKKLRLEFVGDSITCGFGNEAPGRDSLFETSEENGWMTFGAVAGRDLDAEFNMVSVSGISASKSKGRAFPGRAMDEVYAYTDVYLDERMEREPVEWDFGAAPKDAVIINLGTNDVNPVRFYRELEAADEAERWFRERYRAFVEQIRRLNGPATKIICTLGPLDYYLWDDIEKTVAAYSADTGDGNVFCVKLIGVNIMSEGFGAVGHPSLKTQVRMGHELAVRLKGILGV